MTYYAGSDDCTDIILNFIAGGVPGNPIGESKGNYNAYFGHIDSTLDLSAMTLDQIAAFQDEMLEHDRRSSAIGRYQFLKRTLYGLRNVLGFSGDQLFTPYVQDRMGVQLLVSRAYQAWWRDRITDEEFAHNISCEWASLPDPRTGGRSHYDGDHVGNHASTTLAHLYSMLEQARNARIDV